MSRVLLDVPRCLDLQQAYVGDPRPLPPGVAVHGFPLERDAKESGTRAFRQQAVRECHDTAAILRVYREPLAGEDWRVPAASEQRLLAQISAIIALGPSAVRQVVQTLDRLELPEPGRVFATLLVLGCIAGGAWSPVARAIFIGAVRRDAAEGAAAIESLGLSPSPEIAAWMMPLLRHDDAKIRAAAVRVLAFRGELHESAWHAALSDPDLAVKTAAAAAPLHGYDADGCASALEQRYGERSETFIRAALRAGMSLRSGAAHAWTREIVRADPSWADATRTLALFGAAADVEPIRTVLQGTQWRQGARAAGLLGVVDLVPDLLAVLDRVEEDDLRDEVVRALNDITGASAWVASPAPAFLRRWARMRARFEPGVRYRDGQPWTLGHLLQLLRDGPGGRDARQNIYLEMAAAMRWRLPRFSPYAFVGAQIRALRSLGQRLETLSNPVAETVA